MIGKDRRGNVVAIPIVSVSIAIVTNLYRALIHPRQVAQIAAEVKQRIKALSGSNYGFDLRQENGKGDLLLPDSDSAKANLPTSEANR